MGTIFYIYKLIMVGFSFLYVESDPKKNMLSSDLTGSAGKKDLAAD